MSFVRLSWYPQSWLEPDLDTLVLMLATAIKGGIFSALFSYRL